MSLVTTAPCPGVQPRPTAPAVCLHFARGDQSGRWDVPRWAGAWMVQASEREPVTHRGHPHPHPQSLTRNPGVWGSRTRAQIRRCVEWMVGAEPGLSPCLQRWGLPHAAAGDGSLQKHSTSMEHMLNTCNRRPPITSPPEQHVSTWLHRGMSWYTMQKSSGRGLNTSYGVICFM